MTLHYWSFSPRTPLHTMGFFHTDSIIKKRIHTQYAGNMSSTWMRSMHSKNIQVLYQHVNYTFCQCVNYTFCAEHLQSIKVVQKGAYTLNRLLSVTEASQLQQGDIYRLTRRRCVYYYYYHHHHQSSPSFVHSERCRPADKAVDQPLGLLVNTTLQGSEYRLGHVLCTARVTLKGNIW